MKKTVPIEIYSPLQLVQVITSRVVVAALMVYCGLSFKQNPAVIAVILVILGLLLLASGTDVIRIYADRFEHVSTAILPVFRKRKKFYYYEIRHVGVEGPASLFKQVMTGTLKWNSLYITTNDQEVLIINTYLYLEPLKRAASMVNDKLKAAGHTENFSFAK